MLTLSSLVASEVALEVVVMTTASATSNDKIGTVTPFEVQWSQRNRKGYAAAKYKSIPQYSSGYVTGSGARVSALWIQC